MLESDLQTLRSQIELYKVQHMDRLPGLDENDRFDGKLFVAQMTGRTDPDGRVGAGEMGPYLYKMPANPFVDAKVAATVKAGRSDCPFVGSSGWYYDVRGTGLFFANCPEGRPSR